MDVVGYHHLMLEGGGSKTLCGDLTNENDVTGDVVIAEAVTLEVSDNSYDMAVAGNWTTQGVFSAGTGLVTFHGNDQTVSGTCSFYDLTKTNTETAVLIFQSGSTTTVAGDLTLQGAQNQWLTLRSSTDGESWNIDPQGGRYITFVDVRAIRTTSMAWIFRPAAQAALIPAIIPHGCSMNSRS